jgi:tripartite-type tricarboxylate transporter receptor subunit TctC
MELRLLHAFALLAVIMFTSAARAQDAIADFYRGKRITLQVGSEAGGGYDVVAHVVAAHLGSHIPGSPQIVVQDVPGGGSLLLANLFATPQTPHDGTTIGLASNGMPTPPLLSPQAVHYDPGKFFWLGSPSQEIEILAVWHEAPVKTIDDVFAKELIVGASAPGSATWDFPFITNQLLGTKFKIVTGYRGATEVKLAMERGEVQANAALAWGSAKASYNDWLQNKNLNVVAQYGSRKAHDLQNVPLMPQAKKPEDQQILDILYARSEYGRPFFLPSGVPIERAMALRKAFAETMADPAFIADAQKAGLDVDPVSGEDHEELTKRLYATPSDVVERVRKLLDVTGKGK